MFIIVKNAQTLFPAVDNSQPFDNQSSLSKETSQLIRFANQLSAFYVRRTLVANGLRIYKITSFGVNHNLLK